MPSGVSFAWIITWSLWAVVVYKDFRREPGDARWLVSVIGLVLVAGLTQESLRELNLRFALLSGLAVGVLACWTIADLLASRRAARLQSWAQQTRFEPVALKSQPSRKTLPEALRKLAFLKKGRMPRTEGVLRRTGSTSSETLVFQHSIRRPIIWYDISGIETSGTVVAIHRPGIWLPLFQVRPVGILPGMDGGPVGDPVPVPAGTSFAKSYRLGGDEPRNLRTLFSDELLAKIAEKSGWLIEGEGEWLAAFIFDRSPSLMSLKSSTLRKVEPAGLEEFVRETAAILEMVADRADRAGGRNAGAA
jgi:hypothetical protein